MIIQKAKTVSTTTIKLTPGDVLGSLIASNTEFAKAIEFATEIRVYVKIPGGGDYSNTELDINKEDHIFVEIVKEIDKKDS